MMYRVSLLFLCILLLCAGCNTPSSSAPPPNATTTQNASVQPTREDPEDSTSEQDNSTSVPASNKETFEHYKLFYDAGHVFNDVFASDKYLLIGKEYIVELWLISGYAQTKTIRFESIERVEQSLCEQFGSVEIFDKTGQSLSVLVSPTEAKTLAALLKEN